MRLVVDLKKGAITKIVLNQLFAKTDLQSNFGVINLALVPQIKEGTPRYDEPGMLTLPPTYLKPEVLTLKQLIQHFVDHRDEVITRRTIYDLKVAKHRMHILEALITAINNIDEVIQIIKSSENTEDAKLKLEKRFNYRMNLPVIGSYSSLWISLEPLSKIEHPDKTNKGINNSNDFFINSTLIHYTKRDDINHLNSLFVRATFMILF